MKRIFDRTTILSTIVILLPIIPGLLVYHRLPEMVAIHFDARGNADGWASRSFAVFALPFLLAGINVITQLVLMSDPKRDVQSRIFRLARWSIAPISVVANTITLLLALAIPIPIERIISLLISILFLCIGNYLPKCKQNYTIGIRIPWTLASQQNWNKTHRLAGWVWTIGSLVLIIAILIGLPAFPLFITVIAIMVLIPIIYSYIYYQRKESNEHD